jgi:tRNA-specific 2-thiouridylase
MKVMAAMSGGVDSAVAAVELLAAGHEVVGVTLKLWGGESDNGCCAISDTDDARRVARRLGIDHHVFNFGDDFDELVVAPYVAEHQAGRTPNPCVECNRHLKFDRLLERALLLGFDALATGHHARRVLTPDGWRVARGADGNKDQSYVLHMLRPDQLERLVFPVGELTKAEVRRRAADHGLDVAEKAESQDVCFITSESGRARFLSERVELHPGEVVDTAGQVIGAVDAVELVTIGQRRGLHLAGAAERRFAVSVDVPARRVVVGLEADLHTDLTPLTDFVTNDARLLGAGSAADESVQVQTSAHGTPRDATISVAGSTAAVRWAEPARRVAPGQSVVIYRDDVVIAGGTAA